MKDEVVKLNLEELNLNRQTWGKIFHWPHKAFNRDLGVGMCRTCLGNCKPFRKKMEIRDYLSVRDNCHSSRDSECLTQGVEERRDCEDWVGKR